MRVLFSWEQRCFLLVILKDNVVLYCKCRNKREPRSYKEICLSVGVDEPSQVVFATDVIQEAIAAKEAGMHTSLLSWFFIYI